MSLEIKVTPFAVVSVDFNFEELKVDLKERLENYQNLVVIEEKIPEYKQDRANLNKLSSALKDEMKRITNEYVIPVNEFKAKVNELIAMINEPIQCLDDQLDKFEEKRKAEKKSEIESFFLSACNIPALKIEKIFNEKWLNKTETMKSIQESIQSSIQKVKDEIQAIKDFESEFQEQIMKVYYINFSLAEALKKRQELEYAKKQVLEEQEKQKRIAEEKAKQLEEKKKLELENAEKARLANAIADFADVPESLKMTPNTITISINEPVQAIEGNPIQSSRVKKIKKFWVEVDIVEFNQLKTFLNTKKINHGEI